MNINDFEIGATAWVVRGRNIEKFIVAQNHLKKKFLRNADHGILDYWVQEAFPTAQIAIDHRRAIIEQSLREARLAVEEWQKSLDELNAFAAEVLANA
jgi:hypothetical protein